MLRVAQSSRRTTLLCRGEGVQPRLELSRSVQFSSVVPYFAVEEDLTVCNPCNFPVELYSLEFDKMHLEDEKVTLRHCTGWAEILCLNINFGLLVKSTADLPRGHPEVDANFVIDATTFKNQNKNDSLNKRNSCLHCT